MSFHKSPWRWLGAAAAFAFAFTIVTAAAMLYRHLQLAGEQPAFATMLGWQAIIYSIWLPVAALFWRKFAWSGLTRRAIRTFLLFGVAAIPLHAVGCTFIDIGFSSPGSADLIAMVVQRAQIDTLIYLSFGILLIAAEFHRRAIDEAAAANAVRTAMERSLQSNSPPSDAHRLMVAVGAKQLIVQLSEVEWFGSAANYVVVNWDGREGLIRKTLQALEEELDPMTFARVHRTTIANLSKVHATQSLSDGSWRLRMSSGAELVASRTYRSQILGRLAAN